MPLSIRHWTGPTCIALYQLYQVSRQTRHLVLYSGRNAHIWLASRSRVLKSVSRLTTKSVDGTPSQSTDSADYLPGLPLYSLILWITRGTQLKETQRDYLPGLPLYLILWITRGTQLKETQRTREQDLHFLCIRLILDLMKPLVNHWCPLTLHLSLYHYQLVCSSHTDNS